MRVVLDTNVIVSAVVWGGTPMALLEAAAAGDLVLCTSPTLLAELRDVLGRSHLASRLERQRSSVDQAMGFYAGLAISVTPLVIPQVIPDDPDDDHVLAAAVTAQAELIVSGDRHLLTLGVYQGIHILIPSEALAVIEA